MKVVEGHSDACADLVGDRAVGSFGTIAGKGRARANGLRLGSRHQGRVPAKAQGKRASAQLLMLGRPLPIMLAAVVCSRCGHIAILEGRHSVR